MFQTFIILSILCVHSLCAMACQPICPTKPWCSRKPSTSLFELPVEIQDYIAFFAYEHESEKEFVKRTHRQKYVDFMFYKNFIIPGEVKRRGYSAAFCPTQTNIALLELLRGDSLPSKLTIIDRVHNKAVHTENVDNVVYSSVALSRHADMCAIVQTKTIPFRESVAVKTCVNMLMVKHIGTDTVQEFPIPNYFPTIEAIDFNKQGTCIIVDTNHDKQQHIIFPLKADPENARTSDNSLRYYFNKKMICKNFVSNAGQPHLMVRTF
jgi:hypothetical protein